MANKKYINTKEVVNLTGRSYDEILELVKTGVLPGHKSRRGYWRFNVDAVEKYFGVQINIPTEKEEDDIQSSTTEPSKNTKQKSDGELICGRTARKYLDCSKAEFEILVERGIIQAYRDEYSRWRVSKESVLNYAKRNLPTSDIRLIIENHYQEVIKRICEAKSSIKIMTGDFKRFKLKPTAKQGENYNDGTPFIKYLMEKANHGIPVNIICSRPSNSFMIEYEEFYEQMKPKCFKMFNCLRNHAKIIIIDDKSAYVGSANVTPAGLGEGVMSPGNFEAGFMTDNPDYISSLRTLFSEIMNGAYCENCHLANKCIEY